MKSKMMEKAALYTFIPMLAFAALGTGVASAHGFGLSGFSNATPEEIAARQEKMFESEAALLGISVEAVKEGWAEGKTLRELAEANGINSDTLKQKIKDQAKANLKNHLQTLVSQGVITQAQADARLSAMGARMDQMKARGFRGKSFGF